MIASAPLYCACDHCWHAMAQYQVADQQTGTCPKCGLGVMRELEVMNIPAPAADVHLLCLVCAYFKPWGTFDSRTGVSVCVDCRDAAQLAALRGVPAPPDPRPKDADFDDEMEALEAKMELDDTLAMLEAAPHPSEDRPDDEEDRAEARVERALEIALWAHRGQLDKGGEPYILHALRVMLACPPGDAQIVGVLHDAVEDCPYLAVDDLTATEGFSVAIAEAVDALTHRKGEHYEAYIERVARNDLARIVKIADLNDNLILSRIPNPTNRDHRRWDKYRKSLVGLAAVRVPPPPDEEYADVWHAGYRAALATVADDVLTGKRDIADVLHELARSAPGDPPPDGRLQDCGHRLAMMALQSQRYADDAEYREAVDDVLGLVGPLGRGPAVAGTMATFPPTPGAEVERVSAGVHEAWMEAKRASGVTSRKSEAGEELMVPYEQLSEAAKDLDRVTVRTVLAALRGAGPPHEEEGK